VRNEGLDGDPGVELAKERGQPVGTLIGDRLL
jgi:hypothetical protein